MRGAATARGGAWQRAAAAALRGGARQAAGLVVVGAAYLKEGGLLGGGARPRGESWPDSASRRRRPPGLLEGDEARGGGPARLGIGPVGRWRFFFYNFAGT